MPKLTDMQIRAWIKAGDRFDGKADGNGLYICYQKTTQSRSGDSAISSQESSGLWL